MRLCQHATGSLYFQLQLQLIVNVQIFAKKNNVPGGAGTRVSMVCHVA